VSSEKPIQREGDRVHVKRGPMAGLRGVVRTIPKGYVLVETWDRGRYALAFVPIDDIEGER
jgi:P2-related tail formation protein